MWGARAQQLKKSIFPFSFFRKIRHQLPIVGRRVSLKIKLGNVIEMSKRVFIVPAGGQKNINTDLNLFSKLKKGGD